MSKSKVDSVVDFQLISEEDYKILIKTYQQKVFELFNQNIALEARNLSLNSLVENLTSNVNKLTQQLSVSDSSYTNMTSSSRGRKKSSQTQKNSILEYTEEEIKDISDI